MAWYENRWIVGEYPLNRPLWFSSSNQAKFFVVRILLTYGTLAAICYLEGLVVGLLAFLLYHAFNEITFHFYFYREVKSEAEKCAQVILQNQSDQERLDGIELMQNAKQFATAKVTRNMLGNFVWE